MTDKIDDFKVQRERLNDLIISSGDKVIPRFFNLDWNAYREGVIDVKTKEMMGFVISLVMRCDDCIAYHLDSLVELGITLPELLEIIDIGLVAGGSITIPHIRRIFELLEEYEHNGKFDLTKRA